MRTEHEILNDQADLTKDQIKIFEVKIMSPDLTIIVNRFNSQLDLAEKKISELE